MRMADLNKRRAELVEKLVDAAIDTLHHDTDEGSDIDHYERAVLTSRFTALLASRWQT